MGREYNRVEIECTLAVLIGCGHWSGSSCGLYVTHIGFETSPGSSPTLMAPWAMLITTSQRLMLLLKLSLWSHTEASSIRGEQPTVSRDDNLGSECIPLYARVALFHRRPSSREDVWWYFLLPTSIGKCWMVSSQSGTLRSCLLWTRSVLVYNNWTHWILGLHASMCP
jgi:hypothetical protein